MILAFLARKVKLESQACTQDDLMIQTIRKIVRIALAKSRKPLSLQFLNMNPIIRD